MYQDEPMSIGFKALFLMEILSNIDSNEVVIELTAPYSAALVLPLEPNEMEDILMLITPIMLD
jgi:DNA polymerase-3 subunit beta